MRKSLSEKSENVDTQKPDHGPSASTPRWVKVSVVIAVVLVLLVVIMLIFGGGEHGPGRHIKSNISSGPQMLKVYEMQQL